MGNIIIAIARGNVEDKLKPDFHFPKQITIAHEPHTIYMRKGWKPEGVEERFARDIDAYGTHAIPALFEPHIRSYIRSQLVSF